ncbi:hypothetical protein, partial [Alkalibacter mobilis]|uniref:hypothetical protein n=1 Tax=Alkalibacter mobilis TaxID=2787712 RepID=UPI001A9C10B6
FTNYSLKNNSLSQFNMRQTEKETFSNDNYFKKKRHFLKLLTYLYSKSPNKNRTPCPVFI